MRITDWTDSGVFPLQDHGHQVPEGMRQAMAAARIVKLEGPENAQSVIETMVHVGKENDMGTLGDIHPWAFWQTKNRGDRAMGMWAQAWAAMITTTPATTTSSGGSALGASPMRDRLMTTDTRFHPARAGWAECLPDLLKGTMVAVFPGTDESEQNLVMGHIDPRLVAPHISGPGTAGTVVTDVQPTSEMCIDGATRPGRKGRQALLQSLVRVVAVHHPIQELGAAEGNILALNYSSGGADGIPGFGAVFGPVVQGAGPTTGGGTRPTTGPRGESTRSSSGAGFGSPLESVDEEQTPCDFGKFEESPRGNHGTAFMDNLSACGPLHCGADGDKHEIERDADGNPMNSGHISTDAYFFRNAREDAPLHFEGDWPNPPFYPLTTRTHLTYDPLPEHKFVNGTRQGLWRWWTEIPDYSPTTNPPTTGSPPTPTPGTPGTPSPGTPGTPRPPAPGVPTTPRPGPGGPTTPGPGSGGPTTPRPGRPTTPGGSPSPSAGPGGPVPGFPGGGIGPPGTTRPTPTPPLPGFGGGGAPEGTLQNTNPSGPVGSAQPTDRSLYSILRPFHSAFAAMGFRPQKWIPGATNFEHNPFADAREIAEDEQTRPQVLTARAFGGVDTASGDWSYTIAPFDSRARGGVAAGGILFSPPEFEMEDYLGINSDIDVESPSATANIVAAPGVAFAFGTPTAAGDLNPSGIRIRQLSDTDRTLQVEQLDDSGVAQPLLKLRYSDSGAVSEVEVTGDLNVTGAIKANGTAGTTGTIDLTEVSTITVKDGLITGYE